MRGADFSQNALFVTVTVEDFVPLDHPLRALRDLINEFHARAGGGSLSTGITDDLAVSARANGPTRC